MLERAYHETAPGMADFVDLDSLHVCSGCAFWLAGRGRNGDGRCGLFERLMRDRKGTQPKPLRAKQRACRKFGAAS